MATTFFLCFHCQNRRKRSQVDAKTPVFNRGMTYQLKQKGLTKVSILYWGGLIDIIAYARVVILLRLCLLEQCLDPVFWTLIKTRNFVIFYEFLIHVGVHHTISNTEWEWIRDRHIALYPQQDRTNESLKQKFQEMARAKIQTGDSNMPLHIRGAKRAYYAIVKKTDGSMGGGSDDSFFKARANDSNLDEEESEDEAGEWGEVGGNRGDFVGGRGEDVAGNTARGGGLGTSLGVDPANLFGQVVADLDGLNGLIANVDGVDVSVGVVATASTASSSHITTSSGGGKRASDASLGGGPKKSKAFTQPLRIARKSSLKLVMRVMKGHLSGISCI
jgi:hypothetical protein